MIRNLITAGALVIATASVTYAGVEATHEVPTWMTRTCGAEDSVNCWFANEGDPIGPFYTRKMPHTNKVCVIFADRPKRDYCEKRR